MTVLAQDVKELKNKDNMVVSAQLVRVARECGRNPISIGLDFAKLRRKPGKL